MKFTVAIDLYLEDMQAQGRINSPRTVVAYRHVLEAHATDVANRDPAYTNRDDVKRTLRRWPYPNTQAKRLSVLISFYDWAMEEGHRKDNPARQVRRPKKRPTTVYRLTRAEAAALLEACQTVRERRAVYIGVCAGLRDAELRGLQGRHFQRPGFIWVSRDIGKGGRERWVPVITDLQPVVDEIRATVALDEYVLPAERWRNPPHNTTRVELRKRPASRQVLRTIVMQVGERAGIAAHLHPHLMRHAFGDHVARYAGLKNAQALLGHATVDTTADTYTGAPTLDELTHALQAFGFLDRTRVLGGGEHAETARKAPTGIEPVNRPTGEFPGYPLDPTVQQLLLEAVLAARDDLRRQGVFA